ncbi:[acyl-carrier-protein] S-malonyltransferase [Sedimentitalea nanhaiensis]|uniref:Malonyl CoA-acyl carrier protein transacylase n=2 Tax=Sedimentitalea nanhaiensis TaxID=999627 RepID=A0A1I6Y279_9RHOB|nr:[acyl-carrier-protein] S-malonyltransferase [Sedimentitalea nanhaiensis]
MGALPLMSLRAMPEAGKRRRRMSRAFVFPGQGAQAIGMGQALAEAYPAARAVFDEVDEALGEQLSTLIWEGDIETLTMTQNAQPALMATSLAAMRALEAEGVHVTDAAFVAGHSLGEYSALAAAGALSVHDTAKLLRTRGLAMQQAVPVGVGAMAAVLGLDLAAVRAVADEAAQGQICEAANDNDPAQVVVSGHKEAVERAVDLAKARGAKRAVMLPVSAPFHCQLMAPAAEVMGEALATVWIEAPKVPVIANVLAEPVQDPETIRDLLVKQITGAVRWRESVEYLVAQGVDETWEIGAGKALSGMVRRIDRAVTCRAVGTAEDVKFVMETLV